MAVGLRVADHLMARHYPICALHRDAAMTERYEVVRSDFWVLRHHPDPAPLLGWFLLDSLRHCPGPLDFTTNEAAEWGHAVQKASQLVQVKVLSICTCT